jgi:hypothetical protein
MKLRTMTNTEAVLNFIHEAGRPVTMKEIASGCRLTVQQARNALSNAERRRVRSGMTEEAAGESELVQLWAAVIDALEALASLKVTPQEYFDSLPAKNGMGGRYLDPVIGKALPVAFEWLSEFVTVWDGAVEEAVRQS